MTKVDDSHISFAKRLAHNNRNVRAETLKKLRRWLGTKSRHGSMEYTELLKIWKGLHYSMWYSDKPLLQESLALDISQIIDVFPTPQLAILFFKAFCETLAREWIMIDRLRLDKFYMFFRTVLKTTLEYCESHEWNEEIVAMVTDAMTDKIVDIKSGCPDSIVTYLSEQLYSVFTDLNSNVIPSHVLTSLLLPFISVLASTPKKDLSSILQNNLFHPIARGKISLPVDKKVIADRMFCEAKKPEILTRNRKVLYRINRNILGLNLNITSTLIEDVISEPCQNMSQKRCQEYFYSEGADKTEENRNSATKMSSDISTVNEDEEVEGNCISEPQTAETKDNNEVIDLDVPSPIPQKYRKPKRARKSGSLEPVEVPKTPSQKKQNKRKSVIETPTTTQTSDTSERKKVRYSLENNTVLFFKKNSSLQSPTPFDKEKTPTKGVLKVSPAVTRSQSRKKARSRLK